MAKRIGVMSALKLANTRATLADLWDRLAETYGGRPAFTLEEPVRLHVLTASELSYEDILDVIARLAGGLADLGVRRGDRVAICCENRIDYALTIFAIVRAGGIAVPLHHHLRAGEVEALAKQSKARFLIADPGVGAKPRGVRVISAGHGGALDLAAAAASRLDPEKIGAEDPVAILFTSGTTGVPKGATLTSRSLLAVARLAALYPDAGEERGVCGLPLAHVMGLSSFLLSALAGTQMHWFTKFDAEKVLETIVEQRASFFVGVPAMYAMMAEAGPEEYDLSTIRLWCSGADAMPPALVTRFRALGCAYRSPLGQRLLTAAFAEIYGMVELSGPAILKLTPPSPFDPRLAEPMKRAGVRARVLASRIPGLKNLAAEGQAAFGVPIPPYRVKIVGEDGKPVPSGEVGEIVIRGPGVTKGYDRDPGATAKTTRDGWLHTGDLARRNRIGLIAFVTRKKDVVKHGGFSVYPAEVESQMAAHPAIGDVAVFGAPHATKGAVPVAVVALAKGKKATEAELLAWCREKIAPFKAPRAVLIVPAAEIPRNANKKIVKDVLKEKTLPALQKQLAATERAKRPKR